MTTHWWRGIVAMGAGVAALAVVSAQVTVQRGFPALPLAVELGGTGTGTNNGSITLSASAPATCVVGQTIIVTSTNRLQYCSAVNTWTDAGDGGGGGLTAGLIALVDAGACPSGYTEQTGLNGQTILGTVAASSDVGTTGGSDTLTPAGTNTASSFTGDAASLTHSGTAVADHASHTHTYTDVVNHVHVYASQTATTGAATSYEHGVLDTSSAEAEATETTNNPTGGVATGTTAGPSATLTHGVTQPSAHAYTPTGTVSAPVFTGTGADNRSAFTRVIFCQKD